MAQFEQWSGFNGRLWKEEVNVRDFIQNNYTPYEGDESFLVGPTEATDKLWGELQKLQKDSGRQRLHQTDRQENFREIIDHCLLQELGERDKCV